jgi:hypothetical protein
MEMWADRPREKSDQADASFERPATLQLDAPALNSLAVRSLASLFDEKAQIFSARVTLESNVYRRDESSLKRTAIALMGLQRLAESGAAHPFDAASMQETVFGDRSWVKSAGDLGLLTWFTAVCIPDRLKDLVRDFRFDEALSMFEDANQKRTTGLAWFLAGISHAAFARPQLSSELTDIAVDAYRLLLENQGEDGIFGHAGAAPFPRGAFYNRFGSFADQIYSIYALSTFARTFEIEEPLEPALACGNSICAQQGELGQWWFSYDKQTGRAVSRYPVVSLHQDGTAPMGLFALEESTGRTFYNSIAKGLAWMGGANELGSMMWSSNPALIWDAMVTQGRASIYWDAALCLFRPSHENQASNLRIRYESRPDHFGWLLYAFGNRQLPSGAHEFAIGHHA